MGKCFLLRRATGARTLFHSLLMISVREGRSSNHHPQEVSVARIKAAVARFVRQEDGAALAEYGVLVAFIAVVAIVAVTFFGSAISSKFSQIANAF